MICGTGIDIIEIEKIKLSITGHQRFIDRVFTACEIEYCQKQVNPFQHYAVRFATKEAVMKALGTGWDEGVQWRDIEVVKHDGMPPCVKLYNKTEEIAHNQGVINIHVSLSHSDSYAVAMVIMEK